MEPQNREELSEREMLIAKRIAQITIEELANQFYQKLGKNVVSRILVLLGAGALGMGLAKGWISFTPPTK